MNIWKTKTHKITQNKDYEEFTLEPTDKTLHKDLTLTPGLHGIIIGSKPSSTDLDAAIINYFGSDKVEFKGKLKPVEDIPDGAVY